MDHWAAINRKTGEHHFVIVNAGSHPSREGCDPKTFRFVRLDREPTECDKFDGKKLHGCAETVARIERNARLNSMSRSELIDFITELFDDRLRQHGLIPPS
jgi:hypothetical protein